MFRDGATIGTAADSAANPPATSFTDRGLRPNTTNRYAVSARDGQDPDQAQDLTNLGGKVLRSRRPRAAASPSAPTAGCGPSNRPSTATCG
jgi:hypothetical protein